MLDILPPIKKSENGQVVLIILLVMAVLFTLGLSAVSRSITDIRISEQSQESARAFWTAQAGLEKALLGQAGTQGTVDDVTYTVTKSTLGGSENFVLEDKLSANDNFTYWLIGHNDTGQIDANQFVNFDPANDNITVYFGDLGQSASSNETPALVANLVYQDISGGFRSYTYAFDPFTSRDPATNFSVPQSGSFTLDGSGFAFKGVINDIKSLPSFSKPYYLSVQLLFNSLPQIIGIEIPVVGLSQGTCFDSVATVETSNIVRSLRECRIWTKVPDFINYLLFSGGNFSQ